MLGVCIYSRMNPSHMACRLADGIESVGDSQSSIDVLSSLPDIDNSDQSSSITSDDRGDEEIDDLLSNYEHDASERYSVDRISRKRRSEKMFDMLLYWDHQDYHRFRGFARMKP